MHFLVYCIKKVMIINHRHKICFYFPAWKFIKIVVLIQFFHCFDASELYSTLMSIFAFPVIGLISFIPSNDVNNYYPTIPNFSNDTASHTRASAIYSFFMTISAGTTIVTF